MPPTLSGRPDRRTLWAAAIVVVAYAWMTAGLRPFTFPALVATLGGGLVAIAVGRRTRRSRTSIEAEQRRGAGVWAGLAGAAGLWELQSFVQHPRSDHPTISSLTNDLLRPQPSRAVAVIVWLAAGVWLARR